LRTARQTGGRDAGAGAAMRRLYPGEPPGITLKSDLDKPEPIAGSHVNSVPATIPLPSCTAGIWA